MKNKKRLGKHLVAAGLATMLVTTGLAVSAQGETLTKSAASSRFLSGSLGGQNLDQVVSLNGTKAANPGNAGPNTNPLELSVLQAITIGQPLNIPLAEFLSPSQGSAGVANHYAAAPSRTKATGASGAVRDSGGVLTTDSAAFPSNAKISFVGGPLAAVDDITGASLNVGALSGSSAVNGEKLTRDYQIANLTLNLQIPAVAELLRGLASVRDGVNADDITLNTATICKATNNVVNVTAEQLVDALMDLKIDATAVTDLLTQAGINSVNLCSLPAGLGALLTDDTLSQLVEVRVTGIQSLLDGIGSLTGDGVSIDLKTGAVVLDLGAILKAAGKDLNDLPPNTDILAFLADDLGGTLTTLLDNLQKDLVAKLGKLSIGVTVAGNEVIPSATTQQITQLGLSDALSDIIEQASDALKDPLDQISDVLSDLIDNLGQAIRLVGNNQTSSPTSRTVTAGGSLDAATSAKVGRFYQESALRIDLLNGDLGQVELAAAEAGLQPDEVTPPPSETPPPPTTTTTGSDDGGVTTTLPNTGAPNVLPFFVLGLVLIAAGASTIITERRREAAVALLA